jgi:adenosylcobinamide hydrolase
LKELELTENTKFVVSGNVLAVISNNALRTVSSAIFNGGCQQVKAVLNVGVPEGYSDHSLHLDPLQLITSSAAKIGVSKEYLAMVTAAKIQNGSLVSKKTDNFSVTVIATAGCSHGESSGEEIDIQEIFGTINQIIFIDGNPTDSCLVAALITATEAKSAVLRDFDIRSRYTGDSATGSITDSVTVVCTSTGRTLTLGGPASKLGKIIGSCARRAVKEALLKQEPNWGCRTVLNRIKERKLPLEKLAIEISKIEGITVNAEELAQMIKKNPLGAAWLLAASKMDDDYKKNLLPADFDNWEEISRSFGTSALSKLDCSKLPEYEQVDLPPFIKHALIRIVHQSVS